MLVPCKKSFEKIKEITRQSLDRCSRGEVRNSHRKTEEVFSSGAGRLHLRVHWQGHRVGLPFFGLKIVDVEQIFFCLQLKLLYTSNFHSIMNLSLMQRLHLKYTSLTYLSASLHRCNGGWFTKSYKYMKTGGHLTLASDLPYIANGIKG